LALVSAGDFFPNQQGEGSKHYETYETNQNAKYYETYENNQNRHVVAVRARPCRSNA
jgi:hypothetical protein